MQHINPPYRCGIWVNLSSVTPACRQTIFSRLQSVAGSNIRYSCMFAATASFCPSGPPKLGLFGISFCEAFLWQEETKRYVSLPIDDRPSAIPSGVRHFLEVWGILGTAEQKDRVRHLQPEDLGYPRFMRNIFGTYREWIPASGAPIDAVRATMAKLAAEAVTFRPFLPGNFGAADTEEAGNRYAHSIALVRLSLPTGLKTRFMDHQGGHAQEDGDGISRWVLPELQFLQSGHGIITVTPSVVKVDLLYLAAKLRQFHDQGLLEPVLSDIRAAQQQQKERRHAPHLRQPAPARFAICLIGDKAFANTLQERERALRAVRAAKARVSQLSASAAGVDRGICDPGLVGGTYNSCNRAQDLRDPGGVALFAAGHGSNSSSDSPQLKEAKAQLASAEQRLALRDEQLRREQGTALNMLWEVVYSQLKASCGEVGIAVEPPAAPAAAAAGQASPLIKAAHTHFFIFPYYPHQYMEPVELEGCDWEPTMSADRAGFTSLDSWLRHHQAHKEQTQQTAAADALKAALCRGIQQGQLRLAIPVTATPAHLRQAVSLVQARQSSKLEAATALKDAAAMELSTQVESSLLPKIEKVWLSPASATSSLLKAVLPGVLFLSDETKEQYRQLLTQQPQCIGALEKYHWGLVEDVVWERNT